MTTITSYATYEVEGLVHVDRAPAGVVVRLRGEHDLATRTAVSTAVGARVALGRGDLVMDLSGVTFMDASTVGVIVEARNALRHRDRDLVLRDPSSCARRLIEVCGLTDLVEHLHDPAPTRRLDALSSWVAVPTPDTGPVPRRVVALDGGKVP
jgi:anti-sigma B factor antagonist